jgi:type IV pilus assembly protein PilV
MHMQQTIQIPEKNNHGYSIIEAMIALGILSIGLLAIISMQISSASNVKKSGDTTEAISIGTAMLEELMTYSYVDLNTPAVVPNPGTRNNQGSGGRFDINWTVTAPAAANPAPNTVTITVTVTWMPSSGGGTQTITLTSVKADMNL